MAKKKADPVPLALRALAARRAGANEEAERLLGAALASAGAHPVLLRARAALRREDGLLRSARADLAAAAGAGDAGAAA
ncbi:MAG: hypothetical protein SF051_05470, partial [Elusimicrobiota bacterium]|nr:hypothetical protein [Elusimicrobiota bacterium]